MPGPKDIDTAYKAFGRQHTRPCPSEHEAPNDGNTTQEEPTTSAEGWTPPTILLLAPNSHKHATHTVQRHHAPWSIPKHNPPETDVPPVRHSDQVIPRTCWHCGPAALDTPWPVLHLISSPVPHPHRRRHRRPAGMALPLVSHGTPRPPSTRSLDSNAYGDMDIHQRAGRPGQRGHGVRPLRPTGRRTSGGTHAPPTAQMPHPPQRQRRQGTAIDHHAPEVPPQYGIPLPPDVRVCHPGAARQRPPGPHRTT